MKNILFVFMLLFTMISFTATANTTAKLDTKQNPELVRQHNAANAVSVVNEINVAFVSLDANVTKGNVVSALIQAKRSVIFHEITSAELYNAKLVQKTIYSEKLSNNYNLHFKHNYLKPYISTRADC